MREGAELKSRYRLYVCGSCSEQHQYAGFCNECNKRLQSICVIPLDVILEKRDEFLARSSTIPAYFIESFVESLLESPRSR